MHKRAAVPAMLLAAIFRNAAPGQEIHLKTRTIVTQGRTSAVRARRAATDEPQTSPRRHLIVQFDHAPGVEDLDSLADDGTLVSALPDNAVVVAARTGTLASRGDIQWVGAFEPTDKVSPEFPQTSDDIVAAVVEFHGDVDQVQQEDLLTRLGLPWEHPSVLLSNHVLLRETVSMLRSLAQEDEVAYVFPADPDLSADNSLSACAGMLTASGPVAQYANIVHGWDLDSDRSAHLSYVFGSLTPKVPANVVQSEVIRAMNEWSRNTRVIFQPGTLASAARTIVVKFVSGSHGDAYPFDGPGRTLAHTFYPVPVNPESIAGDVHLDADENWHAGGDLDIYTVALHELGHAIGLGHSDRPGDVMYPYYRRGLPLSANDIGAARSLYGSPAETVVAAPANVSSVMPIQISVNAAPDPGSKSQISVSGTVSGGEGPWTVQWQSDQAYTGKASLSSAGTWTASGISLVTGTNAITFTAFDAAHRTASQTITVNKVPAQATSTSGTGPISLKVSSPAGSVISVNQATLKVSGISSSGAGVVRVNWQTASGASGTAVGTERWIAGNIPLLVGTNTIILRAYDANGGSAWASLMVVRR